MQYSNSQKVSWVCKYKNFGNYVIIVIDITSVGHSSVLGKSLTSSALTFPLDDGLMSMVLLFQKNVKVLSDDANDANLVLPFEGEYYGGPL